MVTWPVSQWAFNTSFESFTDTLPSFKPIKCLVMVDFNRMPRKLDCRQWPHSALQLFTKNWSQPVDEAVLQVGVAAAGELDGEGQDGVENRSGDTGTWRKRENSRCVKTGRRGQVNVHLERLAWKKRDWWSFQQCTATTLFSLSVQVLILRNQVPEHKLTKDRHINSTELELIIF